jgi:hypothetical protein
MSRHAREIVGARAIYRACWWEARERLFPKRKKTDALTKKEGARVHREAFETAQTYLNRAQKRSIGDRSGIYGLGSLASSLRTKGRS